MPIRPTGLAFLLFVSFIGVTSPLRAQTGPDSDGDGLPDAWETQFGLNAASPDGGDGAAGDPDGDSVTNLAEYLNGTDPILPNVWYLAEGATGFFGERIAIANPRTASATFMVTFLTEGGGAPITQNYTLEGHRRLTIAVNDVPGLANAAVSATVTVTTGGVVVERTMMWNNGDGSQYGGHTGKAVQRPRTTWYLAEGEASFFDTYILLANTGSSAATVTLTFQLESGGPIVQTRTVPANARVTVYANDVPGLRGKAFSTTITSNLPIIAERAMYFGSATRLFNGGHEAAAVEAPATSWFVAEGRTGPFFDMYLLLANPNTTAANVTVRFLKPGGTSVTETRTLTAQSRATIHVDSVAGLADTDVSASVTSDRPIIVERAMYWPDPFSSWYEAHSSSGVTATGTKWALAEGEVGGSLGFETYIALANPGSASATATLTFLRTSAAPVVLTRTVGGNARVTVSAADAGLASGERFGVRIDSTQPIAVERSLYWNGGGQFWGAGTNETAILIAPAAAAPAAVPADGAPYTGPIPTAATITYVDAGETVRVDAVPTQVLIFFLPGMAAADAQGLIATNGGRILEWVSTAGYYLVEVNAGRESAFVSALNSDSRVATAMPHMYGTFAATPATLIDGCRPGGHFQKVQLTLVTEGGAHAKCRETGILQPDGTELVSMGLIVRELLNQVKETPNGAIPINLSSYGGGFFYTDGSAGDWQAESADPAFQQDQLNKWYRFLKMILMAIASQDDATRQRIVLTMSAGNNNMPIGALLAKLQGDPRLGPVLGKNVLVVTTTLMKGNHATANDDLVICNNADAANGTSYAAPGCLAIIQKVMDATAVDLAAALQAVKSAAKANAQRRVVLSEAIAAVPICGRTFDFCLNRWIQANNTCTGTALEQHACLNANQKAFEVCTAACIN